ncbi:MAG TPA: DUF5663 domain-containing protein [Candidatus Magasanikbacteria bacterium]|nr:DUF5663 domain-containing protein [Candidatus Magasanikbacteria bacterium]
MSAPLYFIDEYIEKVLAREKTNLSEEEKKMYTERLSLLLEEKLGAELMERLNDAQLDTFEKLFSNAETTGEEWSMFWNENIPNFSDFVRDRLESFSARLHELLKK